MSFVRLIEHDPAWEIHLLLRFYEIPYTCDYSYTSYALGRPLPVLIHDENVYSGHECYDFLKTKCPNYAMIQSLDSLVSSFIQVNLVSVLRDFLSVTQTDKQIVQRSLITGLDIQHSFLYGLKTMLVGNSNMLYPNYNQHQLEHKLVDTYKLLNEKLALWDDSSINSVWTTDYFHLPAHTFGLADAFLFGHIARAFSNPVLSPLIQEYGHLIRFFEKINTLYFIDYEGNNERNTDLFKVAHLVLLNNPFLKNKDSAQLIEALKGDEEYSDNEIEPSEEGLSLLQRYLIGSLENVRVADPMPTIVFSIDSLKNDLTKQLQQPTKEFVMLSAFNLFVSASFVAYFMSTTQR